MPVAAAAPVPAPPPPKAICAHCGTVTAVTPVQRDGTGSGAGAVAGAVLGGLLGNQVGGGTGKTLATVVGAVGGGYAGNTVEKRMKKETTYQIDLRMEDGSTMRLEHASPLSVGAHVTVANGVISPSRRSPPPKEAHYAFPVGSSCAACYYFCSTHKEHAHEYGSQRSPRARRSTPCAGPP